MPSLTAFTPLADSIRRSSSICRLNRSSSGLSPCASSSSAPQHPVWPKPQYLTVIYQRQGRYTQAGAPSPACLDDIGTDAWSGHPKVAIVVSNLATLYRTKGQHGPGRAPASARLGYSRKGRLGHPSPRLPSVSTTSLSSTRNKASMLRLNPSFSRRWPFGSKRLVPPIPTWLVASMSWLALPPARGNLLRR